MNEVKTYDEILSAMQARYRELTGFDADSASDIGIRLKVLAEQVAQLYARVALLGEEVFPQSSTGENLDRHAQCRGLARKPAIAAEGALRFSREMPAVSDISIPAGVVCATRAEPQLCFETVEDAVIPAGGTEVQIPARAVEAGSGGNVAAGAVCLMITAAPGITAVTNPEPITGGVDEEGDDALRARLLDAYRNISNGTNAAYYYDLAMQQEGVASAAVLPRARGRGTVDVAVCGSGEGEAVAVAALQEQFERSKEVNVDVAVYAARRVMVAIAAQIAPAEGYDFDELTQACGAAVARHVAALGVGEPLLTARLTACLLETPGVYNARIAAPAADMWPGSGEVIRAGSCVVERLVGA